MNYDEEEEERDEELEEAITQTAPTALVELRRLGLKPKNDESVAECYARLARSFDAATKDLRSLLKFEQGKEEPFEAYFERLIRAANKASTEEWESLAAATQGLSRKALICLGNGWPILSKVTTEWVNKALAALAVGGKIPAMSEVEFGFEPPRAPDPKSNEKDTAMTTSAAATETKAPTKKATPTAKKAPTSKAKSPAKKETAPARGRRSKFAPDAKITIIKDCPWREGTKGASNFAKYKNGMTVKQAEDLKVPSKHLNRSVQRGAIKIG